ncbi:MAG: two-component system, OmpR family, sensor histidine kinase KdpD [Actinomycetota bacterium]|nr:two-component system, OmpR family, sensor histidine kinase KdpD [Actinomycetota bacterium]
MLSPRSPGVLRSVFYSVLGPALVTTLAALGSDVSVTVASLLFVLAVVSAAALGGATAGLIASVLSFLALNFFFTPPLGTFDVAKEGDLLALLVFLVVAVAFGLLLSTALQRRAEIERRETEIRILSEVTTGLLAGDPVEDVLGVFAVHLREIFKLSGCQITTALTESAVRVGTTDGADETLRLRVGAKQNPIGTLAVFRKGDPFTGEEERILGVFCDRVGLDLASVRLTNEVQKAQLQAETNQLRAVLFSSVTHDLKTPLSSITAAVTSLLDGETFTEADRREHLDTIHEEATRLNRVVTNLMDLSRMRSGSLTPAKTAASIDEVMESVVARLRPSLGDREIHVDLRNDLPELQLDVVQMDQVLTNLVENASKFSEGPITLSAVGSPDAVRVMVSDRGPGIPKEERQRMFQPFERGTSDQQPGTGLGLAIAHAVVTAPGGRIWIQEVPSGGTAVVFELPAPNGSSGGPA